MANVGSLYSKIPFTHKFIRELFFRRIFLFIDHFPSKTTHYQHSMNFTVSQNGSGGKQREILGLSWVLLVSELRTTLRFTALQ